MLIWMDVMHEMNATVVLDTPSLWKKWSVLMQGSSSCAHEYEDAGRGGAHLNAKLY